MNALRAENTVLIAIVRLIEVDIRTGRRRIAGGQLSIVRATFVHFFSVRFRYGYSLYASRRHSIIRDVAGNPISRGVLDCPGVPVICGIVSLKVNALYV